MMSVSDRVRMTVSCRDCDSLPKVPGAGEIVSRSGEKVQLMHNGLEVVAGGYYGDWMAQVIKELSGHHEPQEERIFNALIASCSGTGLFVELGSYWSYYTLWYLRQHTGSQAICIEPDFHNMQIGQRNAKLNGCSDRITFVNGWCGFSEDGYKSYATDNSATPVRLPCYDYARLEIELGASDVEVLHMGIQGAEIELIDSLSRAQSLPRFVLVSTHDRSISGVSNTHGICVKKLKDLGASILCEHSVQESYSGDGLIVASFVEEKNNPTLPPISRNPLGKALFGPEGFVSHAQNFEDVMLWRALKDVHNGFYIDVGANHPKTDSVTKSFYDLGWKGINVEPLSKWHDLLQKARPRDVNLQLAVGSEEGVIDFLDVIGSDLSTTVKATADRHASQGEY